MPTKKNRGDDRTAPATRVINFRLTEAEREEVERRAAARNMLVSEYIRAVALGKKLPPVAPN